MRYCQKLLTALLLLVAAPALAHSIKDNPTIVIDTDMGLDDAVTLAMALQNPHTDIVAIVACEGVAGREKCVEHLERMLDLFNRSDIPLYAPAASRTTGEAPPFRGFAEQVVGSALPDTGKQARRPFSPRAYVSEGRKTLVLVLGPLTNVAAALEAEPALKDGIQKVIAAGSPNPSDGWNAGYDPDAVATVKASGVPLEFVVPGRAAAKPESWREGGLEIGQATSIGEEFVKRLLAEPAARKHYVEQFDRFHDELAFLYYAEPSLFVRTDDANVFVPNDRLGLIDLFTRYISDGRQYKHRVVLIEGVLPDDILQEDVRQRKASIIARNGEAEWLAQLLMNELHQHLGVYSVIGVKMGLRAAELLNAPQHAMQVVSHTSADPPTSCLNDGVIVASGCTPGRGLFRHEPGPPRPVRVEFSYNGRRITLAVKEQYQRIIDARFKALRDRYTLEDGAYWDDVRRLGLDIWENWHRRDLFEVVETAETSSP